METTLEKDKIYDPQYYHPCYKCKWLRWDFVYLNHGTRVNLAYCDFDMSVAVLKCPHYQQEEEL